MLEWWLRAASGIAIVAGCAPGAAYDNLSTSHPSDDRDHAEQDRTKSVERAMPPPDASHSLDSGARDSTRTEGGAARPRTTDENVTLAIRYGESLIGTPFGGWQGGPITEGAPMWAGSGPPPDAKLVCAASTSAAGLVNLMLRAIDKNPPTDAEAGTGGTGAYGRHYAGVAKAFNIDTPYPAGTLLGRRYRSIEDQGHLAVVLPSGRVLQSFANADGRTPGVNKTYSVAESHAGGYYEYAVLPNDWLAP